jgi:hypothetical protein
MYAAAGLLLATGDRGLRADFEENYQPLQNDPSYLRSNVYAALLYLRAAAGVLVLLNHRDATGAGEPEVFLLS